MPAKPNLRLVKMSKAASVNRTVMPVRPLNRELRKRGEHLTPKEIETLIEATKGSRYPHRDATLIHTTFVHGLRAKEVSELEWSQVDFESQTLHVTRAKNGKPLDQPIQKRELAMLRKLKREQEPQSLYVFMGERGEPFTTDALNRLVKRLGKKAGLPFPIHIHMLRHSCGFKLANEGRDTRSIQDWLGHKSIQHTVRYTDQARTRFKDFFKA
jgi:type 1 fimbriae regulatory protein FimB/type 1 fimbriae regulatory protein FimE